MRRFKTQAFGKWILAGEHAVLRGCPALAFPLTARSLQLDYVAKKSNLMVEFHGEHGSELKLLFYGVIENALSRLQVKEPLHGHFVIHNSLPLGAGLGASAALCGAVSRWCEAQGWLASPEVYEFACRLEDLFHGESSGVDIAVSLSTHGVRFVRGGARTPVHVRWWPKLYLSYCGQRGMTAECVAKVKRLFEVDRSRAQAIDRQMHQAVVLAEQALMAGETEGWPQLKQALELARDCFESWELCDGDVRSHMRQLEAAGAVAVKPTGSGGGGFILSLWQKTPPRTLLDRMVQLDLPPNR